MGIGRSFLVAIVFLSCSIFAPTLFPSICTGENIIEAKREDFDPGKPIQVCWRLVPPGNPFLAEGAFDCDTTVTSVDAPFPGGGITGDQLMSVVQKAAANKTIHEVRIRELTAGKDAGDPGASMMTVNKGADEYYNSYVGLDSQGRLVVFLDIEIRKE